LKLAENDGWHKRFSIGQIKSATFRSREGLLSAYRLVESACRLQLLAWKLLGNEGLYEQQRPSGSERGDCPSRQKTEGAQTLAQSRPKRQNVPI
jgi:hypothetical protein